MADKVVKIGIETAADTSGAEKAVVAIDEVVDKGKELETTLEDADGKELKKIPANAAPAIGSIRQLEGEVEKLQGELMRLPVGSEKFVAMAGKVQVAKKSLQDAHAEVNKLGVSAGRGGNAGLAIQELGRGIEDLQYGLRGIQNNIPGLVMALGGGAGLAGVISIVAVLGGQLWSLLSNGAKSATNSTIDYLEIYKKLAAEFGNSALEGEKARGDGMDSNLAKQKEYAAAQQRIADAELGLEKQRIKGDGGVAVAKARLDLSRIEAELLTASGEKALKLAKDREEALKRIVELEKKNVEMIRQAEESAAQKKEAKAQEAADAADRSKASAGERSVEKNANLATVADQLAKAVAERWKTEMALTDERDKAWKELDGNVNPVRELELHALIAALDKAIIKAQTPGDQESQLIVKRDEVAAVTKEASENFKKVSEDQLAAAAALKEAAENSANLQAGHDQERKNEGEMEVVNRAKNADQKVEKKKDDTVDQLGTLVDNIGETGGKDLAPFITEMKSILQDKALSADEMARVPVLLAQYFGKIANLGAAQNAAIRAATSQMDELTLEVGRMKLAVKNLPR